MYRWPEADGFWCMNRKLGSPTTKPRAEGLALASLGVCHLSVGIDEPGFGITHLREALYVFQASACGSVPPA